MFYFTELVNKPVITEDAVYVGKLKDIVFGAHNIANVVKLCVVNNQLDSKEILIPSDYIQNIGRRIIIDKNYSISDLGANELYVMKNLIDKQIIDIEKKKVVRVNDVLISKKPKSKYRLLGVDTGVLGILRWIKLENIARRIFRVLGLKLQSSFLPFSAIQPLELSEGKVMLNIKQSKIEKLLPEDLADYLETTTLENIIKMVKLLDADFAADVIAELNLKYQIQLFRSLDSKTAANILHHMDPDEAVDVISQLNTRRKKILFKKMKPEKEKELTGLLKYVGRGVGDYLTTEFVTVAINNTVADVIAKVKKEGFDISFLNYIYVVNAKKQLIGVFTLQTLLLNNMNTQVRSFMRENPLSVHLHTPLIGVYKKMINYKLSAIPVVDNVRRILGIVTFDDIGEYFLNNLES